MKTGFQLKINVLSIWKFKIKWNAIYLSLVYSDTYILSLYLDDVYQNYIRDSVMGIHSNSTRPLVGKK